MLLLVGKSPSPSVSPPCVHLQEPETPYEGAEDLLPSSPSTMPTPPPDSTLTPPDNALTPPGSSPSTCASSACTSPDLMVVARTDSFMQRSLSLEESGFSSPSDCYLAEVKSVENYSELEAKASCGSVRSSDEEACMSDQDAGEPCEQKVPKNIKLPQSKSKYNKRKLVLMNMY